VAPGKRTLTASIQRRETGRPPPVVEPVVAVAPESSAPYEDPFWFAGGAVQRKLDVERGEGEEPRVDPRPGGAGAALGGEVLQRMEASLGADFSSVRIHESAKASALGAHAYSHGEDVVFAPGAYDRPARAARSCSGTSSPTWCSNAAARCRPRPRPPARPSTTTPDSRPRPIAAAPTRPFTAAVQRAQSIESGATAAGAGAAVQRSHHRRRRGEDDYEHRERHRDHHAARPSRFGRRTR
jgi:hypothetical protein